MPFLIEWVAVKNGCEFLERKEVNASVNMNSPVSALKHHAATSMKLDESRVKITIKQGPNATKADKVRKQPALVIFILIDWL